MIQEVSGLHYWFRSEVRHGFRLAEVSKDPVSLSLRAPVTFAVDCIDATPVDEETVDRLPLCLLISHVQVVAISSLLLLRLTHVQKHLFFVYVSKHIPSPVRSLGLVVNLMFLDHDLDSLVLLHFLGVQQVVVNDLVWVVLA